MEQRTRKLMMMHKVLYLRDDVGRLYVSRKGGRELARIKDSYDTLIQWLKDYIENMEENWLQPPETILITWEPTEWK